MEVFKYKYAFITGGAGTGKSYMLQQMSTALRNNKSKFTVLTPTHTSRQRLAMSEALTIHSYFGVSKDGLCRGPKWQTDVLLIDECSMISADLFDRCMGSYISVYKVLPRIYLFGDLMQLPPVSISRKGASIPLEIVKEMLTRGISSDYAEAWFIKSKLIINSNIFKDFVTFTLDVNHRSSTDLITLINSIRRGDGCHPPMVEYSTMLNAVNNGATVIASTYTTLQKIHNTHSGRPYAGSDNYFTTMYLNVGDKIKFIHTFGDHYNGDEGVITALYDEEIEVDGSLVRVQTTNYGDILPICPFNILTVHRTQGSEYDDVYVCVDNLFEFGHLYTAASRAKKSLHFFTMVDTPSPWMAPVEKAKIWFNTVNDLS